MAENQSIVLWRGDVLPLLANQALENSPIIQTRFFLPGEVLVSRYGIVAMLVVDSRPKHRKVSYTDTEVTGINWSEKWHRENITGYDPIRRAHFVNTEEGFSIIRAFALPPQVVKIFKSDGFLGEPMIAKCVCDQAFDMPFDEMEASTNQSPIEEALPLIEAVAFAVWEAARIPADFEMYEWQQYRTWLSFHGWFAFAQAIEQGQLALTRAVSNFDSFLQRFAPQMSPYSTSLIKASGIVPEKR